MSAWERVLVHRHNKNEVPTAVVDWSRSTHQGFQGTHQDQIDDEGQQEIRDSASLLRRHARYEPQSDSGEKPDKSISAVFQPQHVFSRDDARRGVK